MLVIDYLLRLALLKSVAKEEYVTQVRGSDGKIKVDLYPKAKVDPDKLVDFINSYPQKIRFVNGSIPGFEINYKMCGPPERDEEKLLETAEKFIRDMRCIITD